MYFEMGSDQHGLHQTFTSYSQKTLFNLGVVYIVTKSLRFLVLKDTNKAVDYTKLYINEVLKLHGIPLSIILDKGPQFTFDFWNFFQKDRGTLVNHSTTCLNLQ